jgi:hypothetical protein
MNKEAPFCDILTSMFHITKNHIRNLPIEGALVVKLPHKKYLYLCMKSGNMWRIKAMKIWYHNHLVLCHTTETNTFVCTLGDIESIHSGRPSYFTLNEIAEK